jgi:hypothetical protein
MSDPAEEVVANLKFYFALESQIDRRRRVLFLFEVDSVSDYHSAV